MKLKSIKEKGFEEIVIATQPSLGFHAMIAIHTTRRGPALGGIRMNAYRSEEDALLDLKRLAEAMSYKAAAADLKLGGGKAVLIGDPAKDKSPQLLETMGSFVDKLGGRYIAAKDSGIVTEDLIQLSSKTRYVTGLPESMGGSGDPSPWTALGVFESIKTCVKRHLGREDLRQLKISIQGIGHVGWGLGEYLRNAGASIYVSDLKRALVKKAADQWKAEEVTPDEALTKHVDVLSLCALGGVINDRTIENLHCRIVAGGANNQLADEPRHGKRLMEKGILYAPDYIINAGGLINIYVRDILKEKDTRPWIQKIAVRLGRILDTAEKEGLSPAVIANRQTLEILSS